LLRQADPAGDLSSCRTETKKSSTLVLSPTNDPRGHGDQYCFGTVSIIAFGKKNFLPQCVVP